MGVLKALGLRFGAAFSIIGEVFIKKIVKCLTKGELRDIMLLGYRNVPLGMCLPSGAYKLTDRKLCPPAKTGGLF